MAKKRLISEKAFKAAAQLAKGIDEVRASPSVVSIRRESPN